MPVIIKTRLHADRPDYAAACRHTVTLYNRAGDAIYRTVFNKAAYLESKRVYQEGRTGITASNPALLVIPQGADGKIYVEPTAFKALANKTGYFTLQNNDKAYPGIGPEVATQEEFAELVSSKYPGTITIQATDPKRNLDGVIVHVEAGGG